MQGSGSTAKEKGGGAVPTRVPLRPLPQIASDVACDGNDQRHGQKQRHDLPEPQRIALDQRAKAARAGGNDRRPAFKGAQHLHRVAETVGRGDGDRPRDDIVKPRGQIVAAGGWRTKLPETGAAERLRLAIGKAAAERRVGKECVSTCRSRWSPYL